MGVGTAHATPVHAVSHVPVAAAAPVAAVHAAPAVGYAGHAVAAPALGYAGYAGHAVAAPAVVAFYHHHHHQVPVAEALKASCGLPPSGIVDLPQIQNQPKTCSLFTFKPVSVQKAHFP